ncbi:unnamed protein product [Brachionus calyciflorus]|uniref:Uncharacterized protein n=1 Tax=Brachionus calyciflorus TaxID=104777 RepID=A0A814E9P3_9BILA|nr:unnamed protein product [Brachionus calyciflorus]
MKSNVTKSHFSQHTQTAQTKYERITKIIKDWGQSTSAHGISNILRAKSYFVKGVWLIFLLICLIYCSYQVFATILKYNCNNVITVHKFIYESPTKFPAVGFCGINSFNGTHVNNLFNSNGKLIDNYTHLKTNNSEIDFIPRKILSDSLKICKFKGKNCTHQDFSYYFNPTYGNCYTFNNNNNSNAKYLTRSGIDDGLTIELEISAFNSENIFDYGIQVVIHDQEITPFPHEEGIQISYSQENNIGLSRTLIRRLPYPFSNCLNEINKDSFLSEFKNIGYSQKYCLKACFQLFIIEECKCYDPKSPKVHKNVTICRTEEDLKCIQRNKDLFYESEKIDECFHKCPNECKKINFNKKLTSSSIDKKKYEMNPLNQVIYSDHFQSLQVVVNVFYEDMDYQLIEEYPAMSLEELIADIGGSLGLFIGISLLSVAELFEILVNIFCIIFKN